MIFHDRINLVISVSGTDPDGYPTTVETVLEDVPAEVIPLTSDLTVNSDRSAVIVRYKVVISPSVDIPPDAGDGVRVGWGVYTLDPDRALVTDGAIERHHLRGRLHHYELTTKSFTT